MRACANTKTHACQDALCRSLSFLFSVTSNALFNHIHGGPLSIPSPPPPSFLFMCECVFVRFFDACLPQIQVLSSKHFLIVVTNDNYHVNLFYLICHLSLQIWIFHSNGVSHSHIWDIRNKIIL